MAPAAQLALFLQQTGSTLVGSGGMEWHAVEIRKHGTIVTWIVDGLPIITIDLTTVTLGGGNIFFGHADTNSTSSTDPNDAALLFTLIDNVKVTELITIDVDGNGTADPLTDGLLMVRYLFGFRGEVLVNGTVAEDCSRCDAPTIESYIADLSQPTLTP